MTLWRLLTGFLIVKPVLFCSNACRLLDLGPAVPLRPARAALFRVVAVLHRVRTDLKPLVPAVEIALWGCCPISDGVRYVAINTFRLQKLSSL